MDSTLTDPLTGRLLDGRYAVSARLAHGGMATVYLATDTRLDRRIAVKVMHPELARDEDFVRRFIGEAKSVARLSHQNVVAVYDQGADGPFLYLAMEYVHGRTLKELLRAHGRFPVEVALEIMAGVLDGLAAAHASGIVHRDVKPENVLITADGRVKVADFGLARAQAAAGHTRTGTIIGTVAYLAPEQVSGSEGAGSRSDVYSAGVLLYELLTGRQPFTGETPIAVAFQHVNGRVPAPSSVVPGLPAEVDELVLAATSRDPASRPGDAGQFLRMLRRVREDLGLDPGGDGPGGYGPGGYGSAGYGQEPGHSGLTGFLGAGLKGIGEAPWLDGGAAPVPAEAGSHGFGEVYGGQATGPVGDDGERSHTMVVHRADGERYLRGRDPFLGRWLFSRRLAVVIIATVVVALAGVGGWWYTTGRYAAVPSVANDTAADATTVLTGSGFKVITGPPVHSNTVPKGLVAATSPGGRALKGAVIAIELSAGPFTSAVPAVKGDTLDAAKAALQARHLQFTVQQAGSKQPRGTVLGTRPKAGTVWQQTQPVVLLVAGGLPLPDFRNMPEDAAKQLAAQDHITLNAVLDTTSNDPPGTVVSQSPAPGSVMTSGEQVTIKVSQGPQEVPIPDVITMPVSKARKILQQAGFKVVVNGPDFFGRVFDEVPTPIGTAPFGSVIVLQVDPFSGGGGGGGGNGNGGGGGGNGGGF